MKKISQTSIFCIFSLFAYAERSETDSLKNLLQEASPAAKVSIYYLIGSELFSSIPDSSLHYYEAGLALSKAINNDTLEAKGLYSTGTLYFNAGKYNNAVTNLFNALKIFEQYKMNESAILCLQYLCIAYVEQKMFDKAMSYARQSLTIAHSMGNKYATGVSMTSIGSIYYAQFDYDSALKYFQQALSKMEEIKDPQGISDALNNVALIYEKKQDLNKALEYHFRSLAMAKELKDKRGTGASYHNIGLVYKSMMKFSVAIRYLDSCIAIARELNDKFYLKDFYNSLSEIYSNIGKFDMAYQTHVMYSKISDTLMSEENKKQFAEMNAKYETEKKDNEISLLNKDREIQQEKMRKQKIIRNGFMGGFAVVLLFAGVVFTQRNKIRKEKKRSDELLLNILPEETAEELKATGTAEAKSFDLVTVMFTDFKNFTQASEKLSASDLVKEINYCYSEFDRIITRYGIEKIKTIGDAYMCAGGLPSVNHTHPEDVVKAGLEFQKFIMQNKKEKEANGELFFELRCGIHTGPVVAGIVGIKKFAYDIWGDTVNTASRMEVSCDIGKVNISGATYELVKDKFNCTHRGKIQAKNKGEIDMYFVESNT